MNKYTRKQINKTSTLHDKEFIIVGDVEKVITMLVDHAIKECGADVDKLTKFLGGDE